MSTVLIIEDNQQNMYLLHFLLQQNGYRVLTAEDGMQGIRSALTESPDLILLDIQLPGLDGYEVARRLRAYPQLEKTPLIAVTSYVLPEDRDKAAALGMSGYIEKPINPETFLQQIRRIIQ